MRVVQNRQSCWRTRQQPRNRRICPVRLWSRWERERERERERTWKKKEKRNNARFILYGRTPLHSRTLHTWILVFRIFVGHSVCSVLCVHLTHTFLFVCVHARVRVCVWYFEDVWLKRLTPGVPRLAIIVPYRNREKNLQSFLRYMVPFLDRQAKSERFTYWIFVMEQSRAGRFNRGKLCNAGFNITQNDFDYFIFHDVDKLPEIKENSYAFPNSTARNGDKKCGAYHIASRLQVGSSCNRFGILKINSDLFISRGTVRRKMKKAGGGGGGMEVLCSAIFVCRSVSQCGCYSGYYTAITILY